MIILTEKELEEAVDAALGEGYLSRRACDIIFNMDLRMGRTILEEDDEQR